MIKKLVWLQIYFIFLLMKYSYKNKINLCHNNLSAKKKCLNEAMMILQEQQSSGWIDKWIKSSNQKGKLN